MRSADEASLVHFEMKWNEPQMQLFLAEHEAPNFTQTFVQKHFAPEDML